MISPKVRALVSTFRGQPLVAVNQCSHCGEYEDPESARRWPEDEDGDRVCPACDTTDKNNDRSPQ
jgi:formylmethanofuran dehydrogenase subunit E